MIRLTKCNVAVCQDNPHPNCFQTERKLVYISISNMATSCFKPPQKFQGDATENKSLFCKDTIKEDINNQLFSTGIF